MRRFEKVAIIGAGLIGGSLGIALRKKGIAKEVWATAQHKQTLKKAKAKGALDKGKINIFDCVRGADLVILATPVESIISLGERIIPHLKPGAIITDVGSTKQEIVSRLQKAQPEGVAFIGAHPLAGSEKRGIENAHGRLFRGSLCILTPTPKTPSWALKKIERLWLSLGARVLKLSPERHDKIISFVSHLPHILSFGLKNVIPKDYLPLGAGGLESMLRLSFSNSTIWKDICLSNRKYILKAIDDFQQELIKFKKILEKKDAQRLKRRLKGGFRR